MKRLVVMVMSLSLLITKALGQCNCGTESSSGRIVGGTVVQSRSLYPFMAMICNSQGGQFCGGAFVSSGCVVTAAHCMEEESARNIKVAYGSLRVSEAQQTSRYLRVSQIINHPNYDSENVVNDIAVLILRDRAPPESVTPICVPRQAQSRYTNLRVIGWGDTSDGSGRGSDSLRETSFDETDFRSCNRQWQYGLNQNTQICAGARGRDACQGDSGGPLFWKSGGRNYHIGVVSYGAGCGNEYGVYTRVTGYYDWIVNTCSQYGVPVCS